MKNAGLSDFNIIGTKMLRNELRNFWAGKCIDSKHVIFLPPVCPTPNKNVVYVDLHNVGG